MPKRHNGVEALACAGAVFNQLADMQSGAVAFSHAQGLGVLEGLVTELGGDWIDASGRASITLARAERDGE